MLSIVTLIVLAIMVYCLWYVRKKSHSSRYAELGFIGYYVVGTLSAIILVGLVTTIICWSCNIATAHTIDEKIEMYQEENANIEQSIDKVVQQYMEHEHDTFIELKPGESPVTLVTLFPELKADTLVQQQLEIYVSNNSKIRELKEEKINIAKLKWLLYFGR